MTSELEPYSEEHTEKYSEENTDISSVSSESFYLIHEANQAVNNSQDLLNFSTDTQGCRLELELSPSDYTQSTDEPASSSPDFPDRRLNEYVQLENHSTDDQHVLGTN